MLSHHAAVHDTNEPHDVWVPMRGPQKIAFVRRYDTRASHLRGRVSFHHTSDATLCYHRRLHGNELMTSSTLAAAADANRLLSRPVHRAEAHCPEATATEESNAALVVKHCWFRIGDAAAVEEADTNHRACVVSCTSRFELLHNGEALLRYSR